MEHSKGSLKRKVYTHECIYQKDRKTSNKGPTATSQTPRKKKEQAKPKTNRRREVIKIRGEIKEIEAIQRINETKSWFFEKINNIDKPLVNLTKMRREKIHISKIRKEKGEITTNTTEIQGITRTTLRTYTPINWKILKKWKNF
jgi:hypothetical protein